MDEVGLLEGEGVIETGAAVEDVTAEVVADPESSINPGINGISTSSSTSTQLNERG